MIPRHLALIRHAAAEPEGPSLPDFERKLTEQGREVSRAMGAYLARQSEFRPQVIISSPALRAWETAELIGAPLGFPPRPLQEEMRIYEASAEQLADLVREISIENEFVALVGHNPGFKEFAGWLLGERHFELPTAAATWIECGTPSWAELAQASGRLRHCWTPRALGF